MAPEPKVHRRIRKRREAEAKRLLRLDLRALRAQLLGHDRWLDLIRQQRGELLDAGLITHEEYGRLVMVVEGSARRLETYDVLIAELEELRRKVRS